MLYHEQSAFRETFGLPDEIKLTEIGQYAQLEKQIQTHHQFLEPTCPAGDSMAKSARDWYETIYKPLGAIIKRGRLLDVFPEFPLAPLPAGIVGQAAGIEQLTDPPGA